MEQLCFVLSHIVWTAVNNNFDSVSIPLLVEKQENFVTHEAYESGFIDLNCNCITCCYCTLRIMRILHQTLFLQRIPCLIIWTAIVCCL